MISEFSNQLQLDAHSQFQSWRRQNPEGYFLNCKTQKRVMLHRPPCPHHGDTEWQPADFNQSLTKTPKVCSTDQQELKQWATEHDATITECKDCI